MFLGKIKKIFSYRILAFSLCFLVSFSVFNFGRVEEVKANPIVAPVVEELAPVIISILASMGIVVSIPVADDFTEWMKDHSANADLPSWNNQGLMSYAPQAVQALENGYYASKSFVQGVIQEWESYCIEKNISSSKEQNVITYQFPCFFDSVSTSMNPPKDKVDSYYKTIFSSINAYVPSSVDRFTIEFKRSSKAYGYGYGWNSGYGYVCRKSNSDYSSMFGSSISFSYSDWKVYLDGKFVVNGSFQLDTSGIRVLLGDYYTKPQVNQQVIDNTLNPVNVQSQGMLITPEQTEAIGKVLDPTIPDVSGSSVSTTAPITSVASDVPNFVDGSKVGAVDWGANGTIDKPTDGTIDKPTDGTDSIDKPTDGADSIGGLLGAIIDILKKILGWLEDFFKALLNFLKYILVPSDSYFVDTFNHFRNMLDGKFGLDTSIIGELKSNSSVFTPNFIYHFTVLGVPVTIDISFISKIRETSTIVFGGLSAIFLAWYNIKNVIWLIRGSTMSDGSNSTGQERK